MSLERKKLQAAVNISKRPTMFLRDTFFRNPVIFDTQKVVLDIDVEVRSMAEYNKRGAVSKTMTKDSFTTNTYTPPFISLNTVITEENFKNRIPGENEYQTTGTSAKDYAVVKALSKMDSAISRREEYQAMECLFGAQITVGGDTISFGRHSDLAVTLSGADKWDQSTADIYGQFQTWQALIARHSGQTPTDIIMGTTAWTNLRAHVNFMALLDKMKVNIGSMETSSPAPGVFKVMELPTIGSFWLYPEYYVDPADGVEKALIPVDKIAYVARGAEMSRLYGGIPTVSGGALSVVAGSRVVDYKLEEDPAQELIIMKSAPLMCLSNPNAVLTVDVV